MNETRNAPLDDDLRLVEAILFASREAVPESLLRRRLGDGVNLGAILESLRVHYAGRGIRLVRVGGAWAFRTASDLAPRLRQERQVLRKLSRAAIETLSIIAYHQPVTRAEIEDIRGVSLSKGTLDVLFEAGWIRPKGRRRTPGRPMTWGTTDDFLDHFALESLKDLPGVDELKAAGLLDARPAMETYGVRGGLGAAENDDLPEEIGADEEFIIESLDTDDERS